MTYTQNTSRGVGATQNVVNFAILLQPSTSNPIVAPGIKRGKLGVNRIGWMGDGWVNQDVIL
jgi:hypothetical protein